MAFDNWRFMSGPRAQTTEMGCRGPVRPSVASSTPQVIEETFARRRVDCAPARAAHTDRTAESQDELVVLVRKRGEPLAGIISVREVCRYLQCKADQARAQANDSNDDSQPEEVPQGPESFAAGQAYCRRSRQ